jgi:hypothetical protein
MPTADEIALSKQLQIQEGQDRIASGPTDDAGNRVADPHSELVADPSSPPEIEAESGSNTEDQNDKGGPGRPKPIYMSPQDEMRSQIAKRFKRDDEGRVPFNGDMTDPEMLFGKHGRAPEQEQQPNIEQPQNPPAPVAQQEQQPEKKFTIKVRGQDVHLTEAELLERASKVEAADSYLAESRDLLDQARQIRRDNRERDPADPHRPEDRNNAQNNQTDPSLSADPQHPEDELEGAIEEVRYGTDSKEAANKLRHVISKEADKAADDRQLRRLIGNDDAKSTKALKAFQESNPDLANDPNAQLVIARNIFSIQRKELIEAGIKEDQLPKDDSTVAKWHQHWRVHGHSVSNQEQMLEKAKESFDQWRGVPQRTQQQPRKESPRVEVNVNRDERRANIPNQPTRTKAPPTAQNRQNTSQKPSTRSDVIANMKRARGQIVA